MSRARPPGRRADSPPCAAPGSPTSTTPAWPGRCTPPTPRSTACCRAPSSARGTPTRSSRRSRSAASSGVPLTMRGAGTSIAGNAVGPGRRRRHQPAPVAACVDVDPEARTAVVEPGVVQAALQTAARPHGLRFGPDPSTHNRCTVGGMIGNNACGSRALGYGRTSDNVVGLDVVTGVGRPAAARTARAADADAASLDRLRALVGRRPGHDPHRARPLRPPGVGLLPGAPAARARLRRRPGAGRQRGHARRSSSAPPCGWSPTPAHRGLVVLGYPSMADAADATPGLLPHRPTAVRGAGRPHRAAAARRARPRSSPTCRAARAG